MEQKQINQLMIAMGRYGIKKLSLKREDFEISLEREEARGVKAAPEISETNPLRRDIEEHLATSARNVEEGLEEIPSSKAEEKSLFITSPMVGTFYRAASPTDMPFIKPGDKVDEETVVCLVEAMKVMNEVKAGVSGTVVEVLVENAHPIEFGSKLFRVNPEH
jgi:acetyl-CoA carboxylase biotin carboxyl carrier protein